MCKSEFSEEEHIGPVSLDVCELTSKQGKSVSPGLSMPPSPCLRCRGEACERREGSRQEGGGEHGSEGGATTTKWEVITGSDGRTVCSERGAKDEHSKFIPRQKTPEK